MPSSSARLIRYHESRLQLCSSRVEHSYEPPNLGRRAESRGVRVVGPGSSAPPDRDVVGSVNSHRAQTSNRRARQAEAQQDRAAITRAQTGDTSAFRQLVERYQHRAYVLAVGLVRDEQDAQEVVQEAFLRVHKNLASFNGGSSFFTWLYRIVTNLSIDLMRRPFRREGSLVERSATAPEDDLPFMARLDGSDPLDHVHRCEMAASISAALDALPPYHRGVIILREVEGMSYQEIAEVMGVSKGTVMSRLFHARQKLQRALKTCYEEHLSLLPSADGD